VFAVPEPEAPAKVVNIMDALKRSLEAEGATAADVRRPRAPSKKPAEEQRKPAAEETRKPKARKRAG
jgi:non-homologous end joining protein Ku